MSIKVEEAADKYAEQEADKAGKAACTDPSEFFGSAYWKAYWEQYYLAQAEYLRSNS